MKKLAVMVSGGGTNLQAVLDAVNAGEIDAQIALVISNKAGVYALERAKAAGIPAAVVARRDFASDEEFTNKNIELLEGCGTDCIVLAGYLSILGEKLVSKWKNRIINIHPALIPSFCGMGYYGHKVHEAAIAYGVKLSGATVHFVNETADNGPIIAQAAVPVLEDDTPDILAARILVQEHKLLPYAVKMFCEDRLSVEGRLVRILDK